MIVGIQRNGKIGAGHLKKLKYTQTPQEITIYLEFCMSALANIWETEHKIFLKTIAYKQNVHE